MWAVLAALAVAVFLCVIQADGAAPPLGVFFYGVFFWIIAIWPLLTYVLLVNSAVPFWQAGGWIRVVGLGVALAAFIVAMLAVVLFWNNAWALG